MEFSRETLEQVLECLPCAAIVWDEQHRVVAHNQLAALQVAIVPGEVLFPPVPEAPSLLSGERECCYCLYAGALLVPGASVHRVPRWSDRPRLRSGGLVESRDLRWPSREEPSRPLDVVMRGRPTPGR